MKIRVKQIWDKEIPMTEKIGKVYARMRKLQLATGDKHIVFFKQGKAYMRRIAK